MKDINDIQRRYEEEIFSKPDYRKSQRQLCRQQRQLCRQQRKQHEKQRRERIHEKISHDDIGEMLKSILGLIFMAFAWLVLGIGGISLLYSIIMIVRGIVVTSVNSKACIAFGIIVIFAVVIPCFLLGGIPVIIYLKLKKAKR